MRRSRSAFQEYLHAVTEATARIARLEQAMRDTLPEWTLTPVVQAPAGPARGAS